MNLPKIFHKDLIVGLDIGSSSIKVVELAKRAEGLTLVRARLKEISPTADSARRDREIVSALEELLSEIPIKKSLFAASVNCPQTGVRVITTPPMPQRELREAVQLEAKRYLPFPVEQAVIDFKTVGESTEKGIKKIQVAVAASPRKTVNELLLLLRKAGIRPSALIPIPSSLEEWAGAVALEEGQIHCLVDIGDRYTELVILKGKTLIFSRRIPVAGRDFTKALTGTLVSDRGRTQLTTEEAEQVKKEVGIPRAGEARMIGDKISGGQVLSMMRPPLEQLVSEIDRCFDYFREETGSGKIDSLILFGRAARLKRLAASLSEGLGVEVKVGDPLEKLKIDAEIVRPEEGFSEFVVALGTALSSGRGINLLPPEIKEEIERALKRALIQSVASAAILLAVFFYVGMKIQLGNYEKRIEVARLERSSLEPELAKVKAQSLANQVLAREPYWDDVFKELSNVTPEDIYLTKLGMSERRLVLTGVIVSEEKEQILSDFILSLEEGIFKEVKLVTTKEAANKAASEFELNAWVD